MKKNNKTEHITEDMQEIEVLKKYFSGCFRRDGKFDLALFQQQICDQVDFTQERYELKFPGKNYAKLLASLDTRTKLVPDEAHNALPINAGSKNLYISGDNLDALKHLLQTRRNTVDCIYIDPPYNTGTDGFVYQDSFHFTSEELAKKLSVRKEQAQRILELNSKNDTSHSAWLMFMYPRLQLARDLLREDGIIFISIDDNECHNLRLLCDELFGEENFISQLIWEKKKKGSYLAKAVTSIKEYILVYARNKKRFSGLVGEVREAVETYPCINATNARDIRRIPAGIECRCREKNLTRKKGEIISNTTMNMVLHSDLQIENGVLASDLLIEGNWRYSQEAMDRFAAQKEIYITRDLYLRRIVKEPRLKGMKDLLLRIGDSGQSGYSYEFNEKNLQETGWGSNEDADEEQRVLFGEQSLMSYPKPVLLLMKLLAAVHKDKMTVCDFFSGSATTAEAVFRHNVSGKDFQFILVQLPESLDGKLEKAIRNDGKNIRRVIDFLDRNNRPHTLDQIGMERMIRAGRQIRAAYPDTTADLGFQHYTLIPERRNI